MLEQIPGHDEWKTTLPFEAELDLSDMWALCECGHMLGSHTKEKMGLKGAAVSVVGGKCWVERGDENCGCEEFTPRPKSEPIDDKGE